MTNQPLLTIAFTVLCVMASCSEDGGSNGDASPQAGSGGATTAPPTGGHGPDGGAPTDSNGAGMGGSDAGDHMGGSSGSAGSSDTGGSGTEGGASGSASGGDGAGGATPDTCVYPEGAALAGASVPTGYCAYTWASGLNRPRGIVVDENGDVVVSDNGRIVLLHDDNGNGVSDADERVVLRTQAGLNHGITIDSGFLTPRHRPPSTAGPTPATVRRSASRSKS